MKKIQNFPNYEITDNGRVWSYKSKKWIKTPSNSGMGYPHCQLSKNKKVYTKNVHTLVLETYVGPCPDGMECRHLDGDKENNNLDNLCWGTPSENAQDMVRHGTAFFGSKEIRDRRREGGGVKLNEKKARRIKQMLKIKVLTVNDISDFFNVSPKTIEAIKYKRIWKYE